MTRFERLAPAPPRAGEDEAPGGGATGPAVPDPAAPAGPDPTQELLGAGGGPEEKRERKRRRLSRWVESRATTVVSSLYRSQADDLQERARKAVSSAYEERADDLEERAVRAMRRALSEEAERFKEVIEHAVAVKKREVRLSLLVLLTAAVVYFLLDWFASNGHAG